MPGELVVGKAIRLAPSRDGRQIGRMWKFFVEGSELYLTSRTSNRVGKISVHSSGQIHMRQGGRSQQLMAPLMEMGEGWKHAVELRFLLSDVAESIPTETLKKNHKAYLIDVPLGAVLHLNLLIKSDAAKGDGPVQLGGAQRLWSSRIRDGGSAVLVARLLPPSPQNDDSLTIAGDVKANFDAPPKNFAMELWHYCWGPGGNIILVIPRGQAGARVRAVPPPDLPIVPIEVRCPDAVLEIRAPDDNIVASLRVQGLAVQVELRYECPVQVRLGSVALHLDLAGLRFGPESRFETKPQLLKCPLSVGGALPKNWSYTVVSRFDGTTFSVAISQLSASVSNRNSPIPMLNVGDADEVILVAPTDTLKLACTESSPTCSAELVGSLTLRVA